MSPRRITSFFAAIILLFLVFGVCTAALPKVGINGGGNQNDSMAEPDLEQCSNSDIFIAQGPSEPLHSGIPTYTVEITNICSSSGCNNISQIHLSCGWFSSARLVNPRIFKRLRFNDCLVNDGEPLLNGRTLSFQYANAFSFPLAVSSVTCSRSSPT